MIVRHKKISDYSDLKNDGKIVALAVELGKQSRPISVSSLFAVWHAGSMFLVFIKQDVDKNWEIKVFDSYVIAYFYQFLAHLSRRLKGELKVYQSSGFLCASVYIFKLEYLRNQWANRNEILSEPSLGWGKSCIRFWARSDRNSGVHGNR